MVSREELDLIQQRIAALTPDQLQTAATVACARISWWSFTEDLSPFSARVEASRTGSGVTFLGYGPTPALARIDVLNKIRRIEYAGRPGADKDKSPFPPADFWNGPYPHPEDADSTDGYLNRWVFAVPEFVAGTDLPWQARASNAHRETSLVGLGATRDEAYHDRVLKVQAFEARNAAPESTAWAFDPPRFRYGDDCMGRPYAEWVADARRQADGRVVMAVGETSAAAADLLRRNVQVFEIREAMEKQQAVVAERDRRLLTSLLPVPDPPAPAPAADPDPGLEFRVRTLEREVNVLWVTIIVLSLLHFGLGLLG